ncbi:MAG: ribonuclease D [Inquilinaceae bacterium]
MTMITDTDALAAFCKRQAKATFITVDTEFMRENTYWPILCLVQVAGPDESAAIDPMAEGLSLDPLYALLANPKVLKVFHAARQDVEIFVKLTGAVPKPVFDTQIAAMVCGFGDSVGYETLVTKLAGARIDKSSRFTDWSRRPLTEKQITYALADVIHLRPVYEKLEQRLARTDRAAWLEEEMAVLTDPATYVTEPRTAWKRLKTRSSDPRFLARLRELAAWREEEAQARDLPRGRMLRDEALLEIAANAPATPEDLARTRGLSKGMASGRQGAALLDAVRRGQETPPDQRPTPPVRRDPPAGIGPTMDLLRVLLKMRCEEYDVAQKLVASAGDLERIASEEAADVPALHGWRREVFGEAAEALKRGELALAINGRRLKAVPMKGGKAR